MPIWTHYNNNNNMTNKIKKGAVVGQCQHIYNVYLIMYFYLNSLGVSSHLKMGCKETIYQGKWQNEGRTYCIKR